jgi:hypothetical protein
MGLFNLLKRLFFKQGKQEKQEKRFEFYLDNSPTTKPKQKFSESYVEPKKTDNYSDRDLIELTGWVSGVKENNADGVNRQEVLAKCNVGDLLNFKLLQFKSELSVYHEIEVHSEHGCIGMMSIQELQKIARYILNGGVMHDAKISFLKYPKKKRGKIECSFTFYRNKMR